MTVARTFYSLARERTPPSSSPNSARPSATNRSNTSSVRSGVRVSASRYLNSRVLPTESRPSPQPLPPAVRRGLPVTSLAEHFAVRQPIMAAHALSVDVMELGPREPRVAASAVPVSAAGAFAASARAPQRLLLDGLRKRHRISLLSPLVVSSPAACSHQATGATRVEGGPVGTPRAVRAASLGFDCRPGQTRPVVSSQEAGFSPRLLAFHDDVMGASAHTSPICAAFTTALI